MSSSDDSSGPSKREELKKLVFQKSQELKRCKSKQQKDDVEAKYKLLEYALRGNDRPSVSEKNPLLSPITEGNLYSDQPRELSKTQKKKEARSERDKVSREALVAQLGDGSFEKGLSEQEMTEIIDKIPEGYKMTQIPADGDCMFSSIAVQVNHTVIDLREKIASFLELHREDFECFMDYDLSSYLESLRKSAWGSDIELEASSRIYQRPVKVITKNKVLVFGEAFQSAEPIFLSFHESQFSSPHYNAVVRRHI